MRDIAWASQTCSLSFQTIGVWPENADGTDINAVCRNSDNTLIASGDDWGKVKLYSYPASQPKVINILHICYIIKILKLLKNNIYLLF